jgi:DNA repair ATPase RecN
MSNLTDLINKYRTPPKIKSNSAFVALSGGYNPDEINKEIDEFNDEYEKQMITSEKLNNSEQSLDKYKNFSKDYADKIHQQSEQLAFIANELPKLIIQNKERAELNDEMNELINSEEYVHLTQELRQIKTNVQKIKKFLLKEGIHDF